MKPGKNSSGKHTAHVFTTLQQLLEHMECTEWHENHPDEFFKKEWIQKNRKYWTKKWNQYIEKHGNVPFITQCAVCSGKEFKDDIKHGTWKVSRPSKVERDELKGKEKD